MSSLLGHCHGENWKSPTRSFERSGKAKRTFEERKKSTFLFVYDAPMTFQIHFCLTIINHLPSSTTCYLAHLSTREVVKIVNSPLVNATTKSLVDSSICQLIHSSTHPLITSPHSSTHPLIHSPTHPLITSSTHQLIHSPTHHLIHSSTHQLIHSSTHPLPNSSTPQLIHSFTCQLIHLNFVRFSVRILTL